MAPALDFEDDDIQFVPVPMDRATRRWLALQEERPGAHCACKSEIGLKAASVLSLIRHDDEQAHNPLN